MRWIKASERLGKFEDSDIPEWKFWQPDFCKIDGKPAERPLFRKDIEKGTIVFSYNYMRAGDFWQELDQTHFHRIEWLDETSITTVAPPVSEEGEIEERAKALYPDIDEKEFRAVYNGLGADQKLTDAIHARKREQAAFITGANSVRQQRDVDGQLKMVIHSLDKMIDECDSGDDEVSWGSELGIIMSKGHVKIIRSHLSQSPSIPQPGFIEQLRASNPYKHLSPSKRSEGYDECCDKANELLGGKGEEGRWMPIETAPKDGTEIEVNYGTPEKPEDVCEAFWSQRPVCMLGNRNGGFPPGWATTGNKTDKNLPLDPPKYWRPL